MVMALIRRDSLLHSPAPTPASDWSHAPILACDWLMPGLRSPDISSLINEHELRGVHCHRGLSGMKKYSHRYIISTKMEILIFVDHAYKTIYMKIGPVLSLLEVRMQPHTSRVTQVQPPGGGS